MATTSEVYNQSVISRLLGNMQWEGDSPDILNWGNNRVIVSLFGQHSLELIRTIASDILSADQLQLLDEVLILEYQEAEGITTQAEVLAMQLQPVIEEFVLQHAELHQLEDVLWLAHDLLAEKIAAIFEGPSMESKSS